MMAPIYHRSDIQHAAPPQKRVVRRGRLRALPGGAGAVLIVLLPLLIGCDAVRVVEGSNNHVSIRYDGIANGLDDAKQLAQQYCGRYGEAAKLRKTFWEGLGAGERFAFFDCI
jgi:hypothetical protein